MKVLMGTTNPGKIQGAELAFQAFYQDVEVEGVKVSSDVSDEPINEETYQGALNRVNHLMEYAKENQLDVDYYAAIESGMAEVLGHWVIINAAVVKDKNGYESWGYGPCFPVPQKYVEEIRKTDLGHVMERLTNDANLGQGKGGVGLLTKDAISRIDITRDAFVMALVQHTNSEWNDKPKLLEK